MSQYELDFYQSANRFFTWVCAGLLLLSFVLAGRNDTWAEAMIIGVPALLVPLALSKVAPGAMIVRAAYGASLMVFSALHIHQTHGLIEMHFGIFALLALLLYYRDVVPIIAAAAVIAVHHLSFNYLQESGAGVWVFENRTGFNIVLLHAAFVVAESAALIYLAVLSKREFKQSLELADIGAHIAKKGPIDLSFQIRQPRGEFTQAFNQFFQNLDQMIGTVDRLSRNVGNASSQVSTSMKDISRGVEQQHQDTDMIAVSSTEMSASMEEIARLSGEAASAADDARNMADSSADTIQRASQGIA
ncbi:MAG: hypothetical protein ACPGYX_12580, partial [Oceanobacter sp.]